MQVIATRKALFLLQITQLCENYLEAILRDDKH